MNNTQVVWPALELLEFEKQFCNYYREGERPGVLRRIYPLRLVDSSLPDDVQQLSVRFVPSGRRTRVFAVTMSGDLDNWMLKVSTPSGELYTQDFASVSALLNHPLLLPVLPAPPEAIYPPGGPLEFEPNIVLERTMVLLFDGYTIVPAAHFEYPTRFVLNLAIHCWEMPQVPTRIVPPPVQTAAIAPRGGF